MLRFLLKLFFPKKPASNPASQSYIWQARDWPQMTWDEARLAPVLTETDNQLATLHQRLDGLEVASKQQVLLRRLTEEGLATLGLAGMEVDGNQLRVVLADRLDIDISKDRGGRAAATPRVENLAELLVAVYQNATANSPVSQQMLDAWHSRLLPSSTASSRRTSDAPVTITIAKLGKGKPRDVAYQPPAVARLADDMAGFLDWFNDRHATIPPIIKAAQAQLWFASLRPYSDGNGRLSRLLAGMCVPINLAPQLQSEAGAYYHALNKAQIGGLDITAWLGWWLGMYSRAIARANGVVDGVLYKQQFWQQHASTSFNPRQVKMLARLTDGFDDVVTTATWARFAKCGHDTAYRDISELVADGILGREPASGRGICYGLVAAK